MICSLGLTIIFGFLTLGASLASVSILSSCLFLFLVLFGKCLGGDRALLSSFGALSNTFVLFMNETIFLSESVVFFSLKRSLLFSVNLWKMPALVLLKY